MHVISEKALRVFWETHADARGPVQGWLSITEKAMWANFAEVRKTFNSADAVGPFVVFNIKGNDYRLITAIHYNRKKVYIRDVFTHSKYDRWNKKWSRKL